MHLPSFSVLENKVLFSEAVSKKVLLDISCQFFSPITIAATFVLRLVSSPPDSEVRHIRMPSHVK